MAKRNTSANTAGMACRSCGCRMNQVITSHKHEVYYRGKHRTIIKRYRRCRHCGLQFTTVETYEDEDNLLHPEPIAIPDMPIAPVQGHPFTPTVSAQPATPAEESGVYKPPAPFWRGPPGTTPFPIEDAAPPPVAKPSRGKRKKKP